MLQYRFNNLAIISIENETSKTIDSEQWLVFTEGEGGP